MKLKKVNIWLPFGTLLFIWGSISMGSADQINECASHKNLFEQISCYAEAAKISNDWAACDGAAHEGVRFQCYAIFAEYAASPEVCRKIPSKTVEHRSLIDGCLSDVALTAHDPDICEDITTSGIRDSCYLKLAKNLGKYDLCEKIKDDGLRSACSGRPVIVE